MRKGWKTKVLGLLVFIGMFSRLASRLKPVKVPAFKPNVIASSVSHESFVPTLHYAERTQPVRHIVIHSFALPVPEMIERLNRLGVSTHYLIDTEGNVTPLVPENKVAWHAGVSYWRGATGLNGTSIGIELQNDTLGQTPFSSEQLKAFQLLVKDLIYRYRIDPKNIVSHSDIAPTRKADVGHAFPWKDMAKAGIGLWPSDESSATSLPSDIKTLLSRIGYDTSDLDKALLAFERRFMPELVTPDFDISHLEENLSARHAVQNEAVLKRLKAVAALYQK